jgi:hypothetical protein
VIQRFVARPRRLDQDAQVLAHPILPDHLGQQARAQRSVYNDFLRPALRRYRAVSHVHLAIIGFELEPAGIIPETHLDVEAGCDVAVLRCRTVGNSANGRNVDAHCKLWYKRPAFFQVSHALRQRQ